MPSVRCSYWCNCNIMEILSCLDLLWLDFQLRFKLKHLWFHPRSHDKQLLKLCFSIFCSWIPVECISSWDSSWSLRLSWKKLCCSILCMNFCTDTSRFWSRVCMRVYEFKSSNSCVQCVAWLSVTQVIQKMMRMTGNHCRHVHVWFNDGVGQWIPRFGGFKHRWPRFRVYWLV